MKKRIMALLLSVFLVATSATAFASGNKTTSPELSKSISSCTLETNNQKAFRSSSSMLKNVNHLFQNNESWSNDIVKSSGKTIGEDGSAVTSFAMIVQHFGFNENPGQVNREIGSLDLLDFVDFRDVAKLYNLKFTKYRKGFRNDEKTFNFIKESINNGEPVLIELREEKHSRNRHVVVAVGYYPDGNVRIYDPDCNRDYKYLSDYYKLNFYARGIYEFGEC